MITSELDWNYLLQMVSKHRLTPIFYSNINSICPDIIPKNILTKLKMEFQQNALKNLQFTSKLIQIMELLKENGIHAITYKGPLLTEYIYGHIGLRQFGDIDILIDKNAVLKAKNIMISMGYQTHRPINISNNTYMKLHSEYIFMDKNTGIIIEFNWKFEGIFFSLKNKSSFLFKKLKRINFNGHNIYTFNNENQILALCIHASNHNWSRILWIYDIYQLIQNENINWNEVLLKAEKLGIKRILFINLILVKDLFQLNDSEEFINDNADSGAKDIAFQIKKMIFLENRSINIFEKFFLDLRKREDIIYGITDCIQGLSKASYQDFEDIPLAAYLFPLYRFIRPFLLIKRYLKNPIN